MAMVDTHQRFLDLQDVELRELRARTLDIAKVPQSAEKEDLLDFLEVRSRGQSFALPLHSLDGVMELVTVAPLPRAPPAVCGLVTFRGELLLGLELSALVGNVSTGITDLRRIIAMSAGGNKVAILAESVISIRNSPVRSFRPETTGRYSFVTGIDEGFVSLIDPQLLITHALKLVGER
jgi:chemotaxis signal transduction protein